MIVGSESSCVTASPVSGFFASDGRSKSFFFPIRKFPALPPESWSEERFPSRIGSSPLSRPKFPSPARSVLQSPSEVVLVRAKKSVRCRPLLLPRGSRRGRMQWGTPCCASRRPLDQFPVTGCSRCRLNGHPSPSPRRGHHSRWVQSPDAVMASEIEQLPDLTGFLKIASQPQWRRVQIRQN